MTMVTSAASPRAVQRAKKRRPAGPAGAPAPAHKPVTAKPAAKAGATDAAAGAQLPMAAAAALAAGATAPPEAPKPPVIERSPEYDPLDVAGVIGDVSTGVTGDMIGPLVKDAISRVLNPDKQEWLNNPYAKPIPGKLSGIVTAEVGNLVGSVISDVLRGALHGKIKGVEEGKPGLGWSPTPPNKLIAKFVKGVTTAGIDTALRSALKPPPPPPAPVYPPGTEPLPPVKVPPPLPGKMFLGKEIAPILQDAGMGVLRTAIGAFYDQTVGPLVQRAANMVTGHGKDEIKAAPALTIGKIANGFVDSVLGSFLVRSVDAPKGANGATPFSLTLGASIFNNVIGAAWGTVYGRGLGTAIENGVNQMAGVRSKEEVAKAKLPALEHFTRTATRGVAVGATTAVLGKALQHTMVKFGAQMGGVGGALIGMAGAALIGALGGSVVDATVGPMLGKLGGQVYSWITGKPAYEQRMKEAKPADPSSTPGDPVKAPNGNPGTVPAPSPAPAPAPAPAKTAPIAAPAAGKAKKRTKTGMVAVDRTSPAINVSNAKLARIALAG